MRPGDIVLIDTNVILEAHRISCWQRLSSSYEIHTVTTVLEETQTGFQNRTNQQQINYGELQKSISYLYDVSEQDRVIIGMEYPEIMGLDAGERDLIIYASKMDRDCWLLSSPDKAAMRVANQLGWIERVISLEDLIEAINLSTNKSLRENYTKSWNSQTRLKIKMGLLN